MGGTYSTHWRDEFVKQFLSENMKGRDYWKS